KAGFEITSLPDLSADEIPAHITDHNLLIVRSTKVNADTFDAAKDLKLIIRAGAGTNNIDVAKASQNSVSVANCPGKNAIAVAELTIGLMLALDRRIPMAHRELKNGKWEKKVFTKADGLYGKTLGVVGAGNVGIEVIQRAKALGMTIVAWSYPFSEEEAKKLGVIYAETIEDLAKQSDVISVHVALVEQTRGFIGKEFLAMLPDGAMIVNTSRGGVVDEAAMLECMENRGLRYATDVYADEPGAGKADYSSPISSHPDIVATPHVGASTQQAQLAVVEEVVRIASNFSASGQVLNCVNP
ncbi:hydroxyacid dehydrogenase, partial [Myxococcota bacterium]|nr:hydroxyacid dehydrogenase [Myxococcota bacterium]